MHDASSRDDPSRRQIRQDSGRGAHGGPGAARRLSGRHGHGGGGGRALRGAPGDHLPALAHPEGLVLDTLFEELSRRSPLPVTGDLRADALVYTRRLLAGLREDKNLALARAFAAATRSGTLDADGLNQFVEPRTRQIEAMLTAAGTGELDVQDVLELILAPAYTHALLAHPLRTDADAERLVDNLLAVLAQRRARAGAAGDDA